MPPRRGYDPQIDRDRFVAAHSPDLAFLQCAEQLSLSDRRQVPDLVEEEGPAAGFLDQPSPKRLSAGERAFGVPEELTFQQRVRHGAAIDGDERLERAGTVLMDRTGDQFFPGSALSLNQHRRPAGGYFPDQFEDFHDVSALSDHRGGPQVLAERGFQMAVLSYQTTMFDRPAHHHDQLFQIDRLGDVIERSALHRLDGCFHRSKPGQQDDRSFRCHLAEGIQDV